ncbi:HNH endonuclease [Candidatus Poribacteria bacterium]|nr:HNH endonuclease [Candidatus Poribacteria bacterium]
MPRPYKKFFEGKNNRRIKNVKFRKRNFNRMRLVVSDGRKCAYCGLEEVPLEIDHIIPKSRGGANRLQNLALSCKECNLGKGNKLPHEIEDNDLRERVIRVRRHANSRKS